MLLPARDPGLFAALFTLIVATTYFFLLTGDLAAESLADPAARLDHKALSPSHARPIQEPCTWSLVFVGAVGRVCAVVLGFVVRAVAISAAATSFGRRGPPPELAMVCLVVAGAVLLCAAAALLVYLELRRCVGLLSLAWLLLLAASVWLLHLRFVALGVDYAAAAKQGRDGASVDVNSKEAPWRLVKARRKPSILLSLAVIGAVAAGFSPVHELAQDPRPSR
ncbi:hypothetical protein ACP4OV_011132 [Aristida adscensionis]